METEPMENINKTSLFVNGSVWLRADFHLHTNADKEFKYSGEPQNYVSSYIQRLKDENIHVGIITNHNKFNFEEFKVLRQAAKKENIWLVSGVELSVDDGSNGIHMLIAFDEHKWLTPSENFIEQFLTAAFEGIANRENENTRCKYSLEALLKKLDEHRNQGRDSFIIFAHVEENSGFFNELDGGRIIQLANNDLFKATVLGLQKIRTYSKLDTYRQWFNRDLPAFVEGSDCKEINNVGKPSKQSEKEKKTFVKIGDFNFEALKYALIDKERRIADEPIEPSNSYIKSIQLIGGKLDGQTISFSPELNCFIGIRGSGKSSIIEILRYALGISLSDSSADNRYKEGLVSYILGSGGKAIVTVYNKQDKKEYRIEKIYGQKETIFDCETNTIKDCSIDAILGTPIYFGQKDLSNSKDSFETDLLKRLTGNRLQTTANNAANKKHEIIAAISDVNKVRDLQALKEDTETAIKDVQQRIAYFKNTGVEEKLKRQTQFEQENALLSRTRENLASFINDTQDIVENYEPLFALPLSCSNDNADVFNIANDALQTAKQSYDKIKEVSAIFPAVLSQYDSAIEKNAVKKDEMQEEFARIKREINSESLNPDTFLNLTRTFNTSQIKLQEIQKKVSSRETLLSQLRNLLEEQDQIWHKEYTILKEEIDKINKSNSNLEISIDYKGQREQFLEKMKIVFKGTNIRESSYANIVNEFKDFVQIYRDKEHLADILKNSHEIFFSRFKENLGELLTFRVGDKVTINYKGKPLSKHSLGQRASALILFLLAQKDNDILIIDQPEDDLDNQTIYDEVIKEILKLKNEMQFIFATHNANIPVLGDSDHITSCAFADSNAIEIKEGSIDTPTIQKSIVDIMEGGKEAFNKRKNIYNIWK